MIRAFAAAVRAHAARWPRMEPRDYVKLAYQSEFGPGHLIADGEEALAALVTELRQVPEEASHWVEPMDSGLCRYHLDRGCADRLPLLARFLTATARTPRGSRAGLEERLDYLAGLDIPGMADFLAQYRREGCPAIHHSQAYRDSYRPHYRVIDRNYVNFLPLFAALDPLARAETPAIVAIDGRCGSGKTFLAGLIASVFPCAVVHVDDFFLPFSLRTPQRLAQPGGNVDYERFRAQVLDPLLSGAPACVRPFDCRTGETGEAQILPPVPLVVVEGSYAHHPALREAYDLTVFLTCSPAEQRRRLLEREGPQGLTPFLEKWIPLEEAYFSACRTEEDSDLRADTTDFFRPLDEEL